MPQLKDRSQNIAIKNSQLLQTCLNQEIWLIYNEEMDLYPHDNTMMK